MTELEELPDSEVVAIVDEPPSVIINLPPLPKLPPLPSFLDYDDSIEETATRRIEDERPSVAPMSVPIPRRSRRRGLGVPALIGSLVGFAIFMIAMFVTWRMTGDANASTEDGLILTAAGPAGEAVAVEFFVDGTHRCDTSPCRVADLSPGHHFVNARAAGYLQQATRVIDVRKGRATLEHIELARQPYEPAFKTEILPVEPAPFPSAIPLPKAPPGDAVLNLNSIPIASVVVDGRPIGKTPKLDLRVKPGAHEIVFVHPELGRTGRSITLGAGERQTVAVRF